MKINRKGLVPKFLLILIITLVIFIPTCGFLGKLIFNTAQAKDSYQTFVKDLNQFYKDAQVNDKGNVLLIMDKNSAIVYFEEGKDKVIVQADTPLLSRGTDYTAFIKKPNSCPAEEACLCLISKIEHEISELEGTFADIKVEVIPKEFKCHKQDFDLKIQSCNVGKKVNINSFVCQNGFLLQRGLFEDATMWVKGTFEVGRRQPIHLTKQPDFLLLRGEVIDG